MPTSATAATHLLKSTLTIEVNVPGRSVDRADPLFTKTRKQLIARDKGCWICGATKKLEAHHFPIEWSMTPMVDWSPDGYIRGDFPHFDWSTFDERDPYTFVNNMLFNGLLLCKAHHTGRDEGIHNTTHPYWIVQRYGLEGYVLSDIECIHHQR